MDNQTRKFETSIDINVLGYLVGEGDNENRPKFSIRENAVEVKIPRERDNFWRHTRIKDAEWVQRIK